MSAITFLHPSSAILYVFLLISSWLLLVLGDFAEFDPVKHADSIIAAIEEHDVHALRELIYSGVDVNIPNSDNAIPLIFAAHLVDLDCLKILVESNADLDIAENDGWTALMFVAHAGSLEASKYLLERGASPFELNEEEYSAYDIALAQNHLGV